MALANALGGLPKQPVLNLAAARSMIAACEVKAGVAGKPVSIAVLDEGGHLIAFDRMDGARWATVEAAQGKAHTALMMGKPSGELADQLAGGAVQILAIPGVMPMRGGIPIWADGSLIGGIGVGGSLPSEDEGCARAGVEAAGLAVDRGEH
jgi:glc operon protein GlcG